MPHPYRINVSLFYQMELFLLANMAKVSLGERTKPSVELGFFSFNGKLFIRQGIVCDYLTRNRQDNERQTAARILQKPQSDKQNIIVSTLTVF